MPAANQTSVSYEQSPLVRAMADAALTVLGRIVVRAPIFEPEMDLGAREQAAMHELIARCGIKLRAPFTLLALHRRPPAPSLLAAHEAGGHAPFAWPARPRHTRA